MNILIVGCGFVGLTVGASFASARHDTYCLDINSLIVDTINSGKAHFYEPGLNDLISEHLNKNLFCSLDISDFSDIIFDAVIISVGTPVINVNDEKTINISPIKNALESIAGSINPSTLVVLRSTVKVGITRGLIADYLSNLLNISKDHLKLAFCPERTVEGNALNELKELPQIISGINPESVRSASSLFSSISKELVVVSSLEAAELVKLFNNTYRDSLFAISNLFNLIAQSFQLDGYEIINASNYNYPRSKISSPGFVGGPCLTKDAHILLDGMKNDLGSFVRHARQLNSELPSVIATWAEKQYLSGNFSCISISGLAFKGVPATSDVRDSPSLEVINILAKKNIPLLLHDFEVFDSDIPSLGSPFVRDFDSFLSRSQFLLILNNHPSYSDYTFDFILSSLLGNSSSPLIFDLWGNLGGQDIQSSSYLTVGNFLACSSES